MPPHKRLLNSLKDAEQATQRATDMALSAHGLTRKKWTVLELLSRSPGVTNAELARRSYVSPQAVNATVKELERDGLLAPRAGSLNRHVLELHLTVSGDSKYRAADEAMSALEERLFAGMDAHQRDLLRSLLEVIRVAARREEPARQG